MVSHATRLGKRRFTTAASLLFFLLIAVAAQAQHQVTTCGTVITEPGEWNLVNDLNCIGVDGITVSASNVALNLNEHEITGSSTNIGIHTMDHDRIRIYKGIVHGFSVGVLNERGHGVVVDVVLATGASMAAFVARDEQDLSWRTDGAERSPIGFLVESCKSCTLETNAARENAGDGFSIAGQSVRLLDYNEAIDNGAIGINVTAGARLIDVISSISVGNTTFDMADQNPNCATDHWSRNEFNTRNQFCIF